METRLKLPSIKQVSLKELEAKLLEFETRYGMSSQEFYDRLRNGRLEETDEFADWLGYYEVYLKLRK